MHMEIFLNKHITSFTGSIGRGFGYSIRRTKTGRFISTRNAKGHVPPDGHWRFIVACAELAINGLHIADVKVHWMELQTALYDARQYQASEHVRRNYADKAKTNYNARDIINLKITFGL